MIVHTRGAELVFGTRHTRRTKISPSFSWFSYPAVAVADHSQPLAFLCFMFPPHRMLCAVFRPPSSLRHHLEAPFGLLKDSDPPHTLSAPPQLRCSPAPCLLIIHPHHRLSPSRILLFPLLCESIRLNHSEDAADSVPLHHSGNPSASR